MRWCAAADVARIYVRLHLLLYLKILVCGVLIAVNLHVGYVTLFGGHRDTDGLKVNGDRQPPIIVNITLH